MKRPIVLVCAVLLVWTASGTAQRRPATFAFDIVPGQRFGSIREDTSRLELASLVPAVALRDEDVVIGEEFCTKGTLLFPDTTDEAEVAWQDAARSRVAFVRIRTAGGRWRTTRGVRVGTLLTQLERLRGGVLSFSGFGWDYGGATAWTEGTGMIGLRLDVLPADYSKIQDSRTDDIFGDREVRSDHPVIRQLRVRVEEILQRWGQHATEDACG